PTWASWLARGGAWATSAGVIAPRGAFSSKKPVALPPAAGHWPARAPSRCRGQPGQSRSGRASVPPPAAQTARNIVDRRHSAGRAHKQLVALPKL
nr:hypothetical protein [Tanacetum cinerariifolium]